MSRLPPSSRRGVAGALLALAATGCVIHVGSRAQDVDAARGAEGTAVQLGLASGRVLQGELLAAADSGMLVRSAGRVVLVRYEAVRLATFGSPTASLDCCRRPSLDQVEALRLVSRYPQGISPALLARLLEVAGQPDVEVATP